MTHTQVPGVSARSGAYLSERDNQRAVDLIETAERSDPYCSCGEHTIIVAHGDRIWLECSSRSQSKRGLAGLLDRISAYAHTSRMIMEVPSV